MTEFFVALPGVPIMVPSSGTDRVTCWFGWWRQRRSKSRRRQMAEGPRWLSQKIST